MLKPDITAPVDGRQSQRALEIQRGTGRLLMRHGFVCLPELTLKSGRRADLFAVNDKGEIWIVEIKSSVADFRADNKWPEYWDFCDRLFFATNQETPPEIFPQEAGLIIADCPWWRDCARGRDAQAGGGTAQGRDPSVCTSCSGQIAYNPRSRCTHSHRTPQDLNIFFAFLGIPTHSLLDFVTML